MKDVMTDIKRIAASSERDLTIIEQASLSPLIVQAVTNPFRHLNSLPKIYVKPGYGICFNRVGNNGWTDNRDKGQRPLEGFDFPNETEYIKKARRAQLVGYDKDGGFFIGYDPDCDRSRDGYSYWANKHARTWELRWFMNDRDNGYTDNSGTANIDFLIFPI